MFEFSVRALAFNFFCFIQGYLPFNVCSRRLLSDIDYTFDLLLCDKSLSLCMRIIHDEPLHRQGISKKKNCNTSHAKHFCLSNEFSCPQKQMACVYLGALAHTHLTIPVYEHVTTLLIIYRTSLHSQTSERMQLELEKNIHPSTNPLI